MARLFISPREVQLINDLTKEYIKDVVGQFIIYYPVSTLKTNIHPVYDEAIEKIFENPIKIDAVVGQPEREKNYGAFGSLNTSTIEVLIQVRDLIDKQITVNPGDFFVFGNETFEVTDSNEMNNIFGQDEYGVSVKMEGRLARSGQLDATTLKQLIQDGKEFKEAEIQKKFVQQRGLKETETNENTGDVRQVRDRLEEDMAPIALDEGPRKVDVDESDEASTFYDE